MNSILNSTKIQLGLTEDFDAFDQQIVMCINTVFFTLRQIGVGPDEPFSIKDGSEEWYDFMDEDIFPEALKTYMFAKVRLIFDPPTGGLLKSYESLISECEFRLMHDSVVTNESI